MIELKNADLEALKNEMMEAKIIHTSKPSTIDKKYRDKRSTKYLQEIDRNEFLKRMYSPSKVLPVKVENLIINFKLYSLFMKKLRGFESELIISDDSLKLKYWKFESKSKGVLLLKDLTRYFEDFSNIPIAEITKKD